MGLINDSPMKPSSPNEHMLLVERLGEHDLNLTSSALSALPVIDSDQKTVANSSLHSTIEQDEIFADESLDIDTDLFTYTTDHPTTLFVDPLIKIYTLATWESRAETTWLRMKQQNLPVAEQFYICRSEIDMGLYFDGFTDYISRDGTYPSLLLKQRSSHKNLQEEILFPYDRFFFPEITYTVASIPDLIVPALPAVLTTTNLRTDFDLIQSLYQDSSNMPGCYISEKTFESVKETIQTLRECRRLERKILETTQQVTSVKLVKCAQLTC
jgi:hypothetical protein